MTLSLIPILWIVAVVLIIIWVLGLRIRPLRGIIHILLLIAILIILYNIFIK